MPVRPPVKLKKCAVDALGGRRRHRRLGSRLPGFGIRVYASWRKVWCVQTRGLGAGARSCEGDGVPSLAASDAGDGEPSGRHPLAHLELGGGPGPGAEGEQPVPAFDEVPGAQARAVLLRRGISPFRAHARRGGDPKGGLDGRDRRDPAAAAHRLLAEREPDAALAGRGPGGARTEACRFKDRRARRADLAGGGGCACEHPRVEGSPWVIRGNIKGRSVRDLNDPWQRICRRAGIENARLHGCHHNFASRALALGEGPPMMGRLLGLTQVVTTARNARLAHPSARDSTVRA